MNERGAPQLIKKERTMNRPSLVHVQRPCRKTYELELARGASHIASMMYPSTINAALDETARAFVRRYGLGDLPVFLATLAEELIKRRRSEAAACVRRMLTEICVRQNGEAV